jgi:hydrogenase expression/formation protein HypC
MCLGIPGEILSIEVDDQQMRKAKVRFGGITRDAYLDLVPDAAVGDYVVVHVGFAISKVDTEKAQQTFDLLAEMDEGNALSG